MTRSIFLFFFLSFSVWNAFALEASDASTSMQEISKKLDQATKPAICNCELDAINSPQPLYDTCSKQNDYLESQIPEIKSQIQPKNLTGFQTKCILNSQKSFIDGPYYVNCKDNKSRPKMRAGKPCVSEKYHKFVANSFLAVTDCLKIQPRQLFSNLTIESGLHINALGRELDAGIAQMTGPTITAINEIYFDSFKQRASKNPVCAPIMPLLRPLDPDVNKRCGAIYPPENPTLNLFYAAILHETNANVIQAGISNIKNRLPKDLDSGALSDALELLSLNASPGNLMLVLRNYIRDRGAKITAQDFKLESYQEDSFMDYLSKNYPIGKKETPDRRRVVANYLPLLKRTVSRIEASEEGLSCSSSRLSKLF